MTRSRLWRALQDWRGAREVDLAGPDILSYHAMIEATSEELHLRRLIIPVPVFSPSLSSHWPRFVTDVPLPVACALVESLHQDTIVDGLDLCAEVGVKPMGFRPALRRALADRGSDASN